MVTGDRIELSINDIGYDGRGIGKIDGLAVFVSGNGRLRPIPGDTVVAEVAQVKSRYASANALCLSSASPDRVESFCANAGLCGGCQLSEMRYGAQLRLKEQHLRDRLERIAGLNNPDVLPIEGMDEPLRYRNKAQMPIGPGGAGFYMEKSRRAVDWKTCPICARPAEVLLETLRRFMKENRIPAYDGASGKGLVRHLIVRVSEATGEVMAILVVNGKGIPGHHKLVGMMDEAVNGMMFADAANAPSYALESVVLNTNTKPGGGVTGGECTLLAGKPTITEQICGLNFEISPMSFCQVNADRTRALYERVLGYAALTGKETVLDVCCGIGAIGLLCAAGAKEVLGVESVKEAVADANRNAVVNGVVNARFVCGKAEERLPALVRDGFKADVVVIDPPRAGCRPELLEAAAKADPDRVVYVSCDAATLARDIKRLSDFGFAFREAAPIDMFPHTVHLETVALLLRKK